MNTFIKFDINIYAAILLFLLLFTLEFRRETISISSHLLKRVILVTMISTLLEICSWVFDQKPGQVYWYANYIANFVYCWFSLALASTWLAYMDYKLYESFPRLKKRWFYIHPFLLNTIFLVINLFVPILFTVSPSNTYSQGPLVWISSFIGIGSYILYLFHIAKNAKKLKKETIVILSMYILFPSVSAFLQVHFYGIFILWPTMALCLCLAYILLETLSNTRDYLTGLMSRHPIEDYVEYSIHSKCSFLFIIIDLDRFKCINDTYGHSCGDLTLQVFADCLGKVFHRKDLLGRYAGDEFIVISKRLDEKNINPYFEALKLELDLAVQREKLPRGICFTYGCYYHKSSVDENYPTIFNYADANMYHRKRQ